MMKVNLFALSILIGSMFLFEVTHARTEIVSRLPAGGEKVFECQISFGDFQEVRIERSLDEAYLLKTLDSSGGQHAYWLEPGEWPTKTLDISCPREAKKNCGHIYVDSSSGHWMYDLGQNGYRNIGYCR